MPVRTSRASREIERIPDLRRIAPLTAAALLVMAPAAMAQVPTPTQPAPQLQRAKLTIGVVGLRYKQRTYVVAGTNVRVAGTMNAAGAGDGVTIDLFRGKKRIRSAKAGVNKQGKYNAKLKVTHTGRYSVRVRHKQGVNVAAGSSSRAHFSAVTSKLHEGSRGPVVKLLQRQLRRLAYVTTTRGTYDASTSRAVLAYRKVNHMSRITSVNRAMMAKLLTGRGGYRLRHPSAGKHVEADLSRQVLVLADHGRPERIYPISSGKPSTPTVVGSFRFYRKDPGYNSEGMYYSSYFIRGYAVHGYASVPTYAASHGCLRTPIAVAVSIYNWIDVGDRIFVYTKGKGSTRVMPNAGP